MVTFIESKVVPVLIRIGENKILVAVRNGIALTLPFAITGSLFLIIANLPIPGWSEWLGPWADKNQRPGCRHLRRNWPDFCRGDQL